VIIGSRDPDRYARTASELGGHRVHPFIADINDSAQVEHALELMHGGKLQPTDIVHAAAGGLEPVLRDVARLTIGLKRLRGAELDQAHKAACNEVALLVGATLGLSHSVNFLAPSRLLDLLAPKLLAGGSVTFYSSLWSSFYPHPQVPAFYRGVAESKQAMEQWLEGRAYEWASSGITTAIISSQPILDTRMGYLLDRFCGELLAPADRDRWLSTCVNCADLVAATIGVVERSGSGSTDGLLRLFLPSSDDLVDHLASDDPRTLYPLAWTMTAPSWSKKEASGES
jgi:NAD(P)-dependent dehydrogenase (short-subunit alcohol dehydrogenase family)